MVKAHIAALSQIFFLDNWMDVDYRYSYDDGNNKVEYEPSIVERGRYECIKTLDRYLPKLVISRCKNYTREL